MSICAYSKKFCFLAVGGVEGTLIIFDLFSKLKLTQHSMHLSEILFLAFYDEHSQLISISVDRHICVWDSHTQTCIQSLQDYSWDGINFGVAAFSRRERIILAGFKKVKAYKLIVNDKMRLENVQTKALKGDQAQI